MRKVFLALGFVLVCSAFVVMAEDDFRLVNREDARMNAAFKKAKSTLGGFLKLVDRGRNKNSIYGAYVKIEDGGQVEYLWVTDVQKYKDFYIGYVVSSPRLVKNVKGGDTIGYEVSDIFDWEHYDKVKKVTHGAFTTCALLDPASKEDAEYVKKNGMKCEF